MYGRSVINSSVIYRDDGSEMQQSDFACVTCSEERVDISFPFTPNSNEVIDSHPSPHPPITLMRMVDMIHPALPAARYFIIIAPQRGTSHCITLKWSFEGWYTTILASKWKRMNPSLASFVWRVNEKGCVPEGNNLYNSNTYTCL